jgi:hypothetical protein
MRPNLRSPALPHLVILAVPAAAFLYVLFGGAQAQLLAQWFQSATWTLNWVAGVLIAIALVLIWSASRRTMNEARIYGGATLMAFGFDCLIDSLAFQLAVAWPAAGLVLLAVAATWIVVWTMRSLRSVSISSSVVIECDAAKVFSFVANDANQPQYISMVEAVEQITAGPIGPGTQFRGRARLGPNKIFEGVSEIVDYEPTSRVTSRVLARMPNLDVFTFEPVANGTLMTLRFESETSYSAALLGAVLFRSYQERRTLNIRNESWAKLKQILESGASESPGT